MLTEEEITSVIARINNKESFILNITAAWCPDCTEKQLPHLLGFSKLVGVHFLDVVCLQAQFEKNVYVSAKYESFVLELGGHGFPRTVLYREGKAIDTDNVEVFTASGLANLAKRFSTLMNDDET